MPACSNAPSVPNPSSVFVAGRFTRATVTTRAAATAAKDRQARPRTLEEPSFGSDGEQHQQGRRAEKEKPDGVNLLRRASGNNSQQPESENRVDEAQEDRKLDEAPDVPSTGP